MKIYCASDLHLGYERANYDKIVEFLELARIDADQLILVGDIFDLWRYPVAKIEKATMPGFQSCLKQLKATARDIPVTIVPGNHDYNLVKVWGRFNAEYNISVSNDYSLRGIHYTHGWKFDVQQRRYSWAYNWLVAKFPYLYQKFMRKPARMGMGKNDTLNPAIERVHREALQYVEQHHLNYLIMGHTHVPGMFKRVVDCGDFVDSCSYVVIDAGIPSVKFIK